MNGPKKNTESRIERWAADVFTKGCTIEHAARCPKCGEPVNDIVGGGYRCYDGHVFLSRHDLNGDLRFWHGSLPLEILTVLIAIAVLFGEAEKAIRNIVS